MDYVYAFLCGVSAKIYDDLVDNNIIQNDVIKEVLKGSQWILLTLISYNDFNFTLIFYIANLIHLYFNGEGYSKPYEKSLLILYPILLLVSFSTITPVSIYTCFFMIGLFAVMAIEPILIPEEYSYKKLLTRIIFSIINVIGIIIYSYFNISPSIIKISYNVLGYNLFSSGFQAYLLLNSPST